MFSISISEIGVFELSCILLLLSATLYSLVNIRRRLKLASKWRLYGLVIFHLTAVIVILGLLLEPTYLTNKREVVSLITNSNFGDLAKASRPSYLLLDQTNDDETFNILVAQYQQQTIDTAEQIILRHPVISKIRIIGDGLTENEWQNFPDIEIVYQPPTVKLGVIQPNWNTQINLGDFLIFTGQLQSAIDGIHTIQLVDPAGGIVDSVNVRSGETLNLETIPKLEGLHQYKLIITSSDPQSKVVENIPIEVTSMSKAKILVLQSSPSFETKQLQNWAGDHGIQLLVRTRISQQKYITRSTNLSDAKTKIGIYKSWGNDLFGDFDLIVIDGRELLSLSDKESNELLKHIKNGLGVLVIADHNLLGSTKDSWPNILNGFKVTTLTKETETSVSLVDDNLNSSPLEDEYVSISAHSISFPLIDKASFKSLIETPSGNSIVAVRNKQSGRIAISLLKETHHLITSAQVNSYSQLWQHLIRKISRESQLTEIELKTNQPIYTQNQRVGICYREPSKQKNLPSVLVATHHSENNLSQEIRLQADLAIQNQYCGYFWPRLPGWYDISTKNTKLDDSSLVKPFYVTTQNSWLANRQRHKIRATLSKQAAFQPSKIPIFYVQPISEWIFWWLFLISATLIWVERKLSG